jgi:hypothetical protein
MSALLVCDGSYNAALSARAGVSRRGPQDCSRSVVKTGGTIGELRIRSKADIRAQSLARIHS